MKLPSLSKEEWISVLHLASGWGFLRVKATARIVLEHFDSLTSLEKIQLGRDLSIPSWVIDGFVGFVQAETITDEEALEIDSGAEATTSYKLFRIRELRIKVELIGLKEKETFSVKEKVQEIFKEELDRLRSAETMFSDLNTNEKLAKKYIEN